MAEGRLRLEHETVLVTGAAGFIGAALSLHLLETYPEIRVVGLDNMNDYYDVRLKEARLQRLKAYDRFIFGEDTKINIADKNALDAVFTTYTPGVVVHLAAQAGVRYSIDHPDTYIESNLIGFYHILESCRAHPVRHLVYASSSSVYGNQEKTPYSVSDKTDEPVSLYAATKKSDELLAHAYSKLYGIPATGLRFFTVYGPYGRPDMACYGFTDRLIAGKPIQIFNYGNCQRDFTYIDDIVEGVTRVMAGPPFHAAKEDEGGVPHRVYNIGNHSPVNLLEFVRMLKDALQGEGLLPEAFDLDAAMELVPMQPGDVAMTYADVEDLQRDFGFSPDTSLADGLKSFAAWYRGYHKI